MPDETQTSHEPTTRELAHAELEAQHPGDIAGEAHGPDDHGEAHGHGDHAHPGEELGPVNTAAWSAFAVGIAAGLLVVLCLVLTLSVIGAS